MCLRAEARLFKSRLRLRNPEEQQSKLKIIKDGKGSESLEKGFFLGPDKRFLFFELDSQELGQLERSQPT